MKPKVTLKVAEPVKLPPPTVLVEMDMETAKDIAVLFYYNIAGSGPVRTRIDALLAELTRAGIVINESRFEGYVAVRSK